MGEAFEPSHAEIRDAMLEGRKSAPSNLGNVLVLGLGVSGKAAVEYLVPVVGVRVSTLTILGGKSNPQIVQWCEDVCSECPDGSVSVVFDSEDSASCLPEGVSEFDVCIASPGISAFSDMYMNAKNCSRSVISEVEFAWRESPADSVWIAITGTNGKTTTTALVEHLLKDCGFHAKAVGNIGDACIKQVAADLEATAGVPYYVVETSSYQLASVDRFAPNAAIMLGITPDHIKWHRTHEHYAASKMKVFDNLADVEGACAILDATNDEVRAKVREMKAQGESLGFAYIPIGTKMGVTGDMRKACGSKNAAFVNADEMLEVAHDGVDDVLCGIDSLEIRGVHNQINALAAASAALAVGADAAKVAESLQTFKPLEHRIEPSGEHEGVAYFNDSKATNVDATLVALKSFLPKKPIAMFGGDDKGTDLSLLVESVRENVKAAICYGEGGPRFYDALSVVIDEGVDVRLVDTFDQAFDAASSMAQSGDVVLLSPACASFDEFSCFEERGQHFKNLVKALGR